MERLNPRVRIVWLMGVAASAVLFGLAVAAFDRFVFGVGDWFAVAAFLVVALLGAVFVVFRYRIWRFEVRGDNLYIERGVLTRVKTVVPFVRVQHVDSQRGPVERVAGLASVVVYTAGSRGADVTVPGLTPDRADNLQDRLRRLAIESESEDAV